MKSPSDHHPIRPGATLMEAVISIGILAVAIPLVFGALAEAGRTGSDSDSANRSTVIVAECLRSVDRLRDGLPGWFDPSPPGAPFPPEGETWALAFREDGKVIARITNEEYQSGLRDKEGEPVRYLARLQAETMTQTVPPSLPSLLRLSITLEYPAIESAESRESRRFTSLLK